MATSYAVIPMECPECGAEINCHVPVQPGSTTGYDPPYDVECPTCKERVSLDLPGEPIGCIVGR